MKIPQKILDTIDTTKARQEYHDWWNDSWIPSKDFANPVLLFSGLLLRFSFYDDELIPRDFEGTIPSYATWKELVEAVNEFYEQNDAETIDNFNWMILALDDKKKSQPYLTPQQDKSGYIYLVQSGNLYKIGMTKDLEKRITDLQHAIPAEINMVLSEAVDDAPKVERSLHKYFEDKRVKGEWFNLDEEDIQYIEGLLANNLDKQDLSNW